MPPIIHKGIGIFQRNVRRGFLAAVLAVTSVVGSTLWATIAMMPYYQMRLPPAPLSAFESHLSARNGVPPELAWFFVQYSYLSDNVHIRAKNHHTFIVTDGPRGRDYVVSLAQNFRRVEIYFSDDKQRTTVHVFT